MSERNRAFEELREHVDTLDTSAVEKIDRGAHDLIIICGDDGKQIAFRGTCPKCGSENGWVPAGRVTLAHLKDLGEDTLNEIRRILSEHQR